MLTSDPVVQFQELAAIVAARSPKTITRDEMSLLLELADRIVAERPDFLDGAEPAFLIPFFAFRRRVSEIRAAGGA